jgi:hypothetical protein
MSYNYGGQLFKKHAYKFKNIFIDLEKREHALELYSTTVMHLRRDYGIPQGMHNYSLQLMIDEIATATVRIRMLEDELMRDREVGSEFHKSLEDHVEVLKNSRRKALEALAYHGNKGGKTGMAPFSRGVKSYREKMNRSKKFEQVEEIDKTLHQDDQDITYDGLLPTSADGASGVIGDFGPDGEKGSESESPGTPEVGA